MSILASIAAVTLGTAIANGVSQYFAADAAADAQEKAIDAQLQAQGVAIEERKRISKMIKGLRDPTYSKKLDAADIEKLFNYFPEITPYIVESAPEALPIVASISPQLIKDIQEQYPQVEQIIREEAPKMVEKTQGAKEGQEAQRMALQALRAVGTEGDMISKMEMAKGRESAATAEAGQRGALTEEMARRGQLGGGRELLMKLAGQQASQQNAAMMGMDEAQNAIRNRLGALAQGASIGGQIYGQEMALANKNTDIINSYNQRNTAYSRNQEAKRIADINAYQAREAQAQRQLEMANTGIQNRQAERETDYMRGQANNQWSANEAWKQRTTAGQNAWNTNKDAIMNRAAADRDAGVRDLTLGERAREDSIERERYNRDVGKIQLEQGLSGQIVGDAQNAAQIEANRANIDANRAAANAQFMGDLTKSAGEAYGAYQMGQMNDLDMQIKEEELRKRRGY